MSGPGHAARDARSAARAARRRGRRERERAARARAPEPKEMVSGAGLPLDPGVRRELEERLGHDLGRVRLHTDRDAGALTELLGADAVAVGEEIFFRSGAYAPGTAEGRRLLVHEVLHTVQNPHGLGALRAGRGLGAVSLPHEPAEREAEGAARELTAPEPPGHAADGGAAPARAEVPAQATPGWLRYATVDADRARAERLDPATLVDRLTGGVLRSLRGDPGDRSGRVRAQLGRMAPELRESVLDRLEVRLFTGEYHRLLDLLAEEETSPSAPEAEPADVPEPLPDALDLIERYREADAARPRWPERRERDRSSEGRPAEERERDGAADGGPEGPAAAPPRPAPAASFPASAPSPAEGSAAADGGAESEAASAERDAEEEKAGREEEKAREEETTEPEAAEDERRESVGPDRAEEPEEAAPDPLADEEREPGRPGAEEQPLGLDPAARSGPAGPGPAADEEEAAEAADENSAWNTELSPEDFLPATDPDISAVPTVEEDGPDAATAPTFPDPPPTRAERVRAEREKESRDDAAVDREAVPDPAEAEAESAGEPEARTASAHDAAAGRADRDLRTGQSVEQEVGPDPALDSGAGAPDAAAERPAPDPAEEGAGAAEETSEPAEAEPPSPTGAAASGGEVDVPATLATSAGRQRALGGAGAARFTSPASAETQPASAAVAVDEPASGTTAVPEATDSGRPPETVPSATVAATGGPGEATTAPAPESGPGPGGGPGAEPVPDAASGSDTDTGSETDTGSGARGSGRRRAGRAGPGGGGGGGAPVPPLEKRQPSAPDLAGTDPEAGLSAAAGLRPHVAREAMDGVDAAIGSDVGRERQALADSPPRTERPSGAPRTLSGSPDAAPPGEYSDGEVAEVDSPEAEEAEVEGSKEPEGALPGEDVELSAGEMAVSGIVSVGAGIVNGISNAVGGGDVVDTDALLKKILDLPTEDEALAGAEMGSAPGVEMKGETDERAGEQSAELAATGGELIEDGRDDSERPMGEDQVYPDVPPETLTADVPAHQDQQRPASGGGAPTGEVDPEAVSAVAEHERGPELTAAYRRGHQDMAGERETRDREFGEKQRKHEGEVRSEIDRSTEAQAAERRRTLDEVDASRVRWRREQDEELADVEEREGRRDEDVREEVREKEEETDEEVGEKKEDNEEEAEEKREEAEEEAEREREDAEDDSGNWLSRAIDWIVEQLNKLKDAIIGIFEAAREAVTGLIEDFVDTVTGWIERAREFIVGLFEEFVAFLVELGQALLEALKEIARAIRDVVIAIRDAAIALVNELAEQLMNAVRDLLDKLGIDLDAVLAALRKGLEAALDAVRSAIDSVLDFAKGMLLGLGEWMAIAGDIVSNPGGWVGNAASSAETGARRHLFNETQTAVKEWFNQKVQELLGIDQETFDLLISGGMSKEEIVEEAWAAVVPQLPLIIGEAIVTKVVAKLIPGAGWVMAVIDALRAAWGAFSEILRAFGLFMDYLKAVKGGRAALPFARAIAAGVVALLELIYQALMTGVGKYVRPVGRKLKGQADGLRKQSPDQPGSRERKEKGEEVNAAHRQLDKADRELSAPPKPRGPDTSGTPATRRTSGADSRGSQDPRGSGDARDGRGSGDARDGDGRRADQDAGSDRRGSDRRAPDRRDAGRSSPASSPRRRSTSPAGRARRRARQTTKAALHRTRRAKRALGRDGRRGRAGRRLDDRARRTRDAYRRRRDTLRDRQKRRDERRRRTRDERRRKENSEQSKAARLRKIVARIEPKLRSLLDKGLPQPAVRGVLGGMRAWYRLSRLTVNEGRGSFDFTATLNPSLRFGEAYWDKLSRVGADGIRRFDENAEGTRRFSEAEQNVNAERYGQAELGHHMRDLPRDQRRAVLEYSEYGWVYNQMLRPHDDPEDLLKLWRDPSVYPGTRRTLERIMGSSGTGRHGRYTPEDIEAAARRSGLDDSDQARLKAILDVGAPGGTAEQVRSRQQRVIAAHMKFFDNPERRLTQSFGRYPTAEDFLERNVLIDEATRAQRLPEGLEVHRTLRDVTFMEGFDRRDPMNLGPLVGTTQREEGFMSTSVGGESTFAGAPYRLRIKVPEGARALWIGRTSKYPHQRELLLPSNTRYRITEIRPHGRTGPWTLIAEIR